MASQESQDKNRGSIGQDWAKSRVRHGNTEIAVGVTSSSFPDDLRCEDIRGVAHVTESDCLFFPPHEILEAMNLRVDPEAGTSGLLVAAMGRLKEPLLVNPPFQVRDEYSGMEKI
jgi:hypothetical protein